MADILTGLVATVRRLTNAIALNVAIVDGNGNQIASFGGTGGTSSQDGEAATPGTTQGTAAMGMYESSPSSVDDGDVGILGMTADRKLKVEGSFSADPPSSTSCASTSVAESASSQTLLASNSSRTAFIIENDSDAALFVKFGTTASATSFQRKILPRGSLSTADIGINYTGRIDGIWESAPGTAGHDSARVSELT